MLRPVLALLLITASAAAAQQPPARPTTIAQATSGAARQDGYFPIYFDARTGKLQLEVGRLDTDFLYLNSLATGLGSNDLGLDRGTIDDAAVVRFERHGGRLFLVRRNLDFRATSNNPDLVRSVEESFASSIIASFPIVAEENGRYLIDVTDFFLQDTYNVRGVFQRAQQGSFRLDRNRSAIYEPRTKAFPKNTEIEATLTFESDAPGTDVAAHAPDPRAVTLRQHHSFVELPDAAYQPRAFDPRIGVNALTFQDFSRPFDVKPESRWIRRWRLQKKSPGTAMSEPVKPIVYYLDPAVPEPYRTAFRDGARWWNKVFEAAGFINAFVIEDLPAGVDPMDARYSVVQWVHRSTPGFSIGPSFVDPRTGEIIKAAVKMDTYRSITDYNIFAGLLPALGANAPDGEEFTMSRRRQHVAHEIGHTLGLAHNFISHAYGRASVMDYPAPLITLRSDGTLDISQAYRAGPGAYDSLAIRYAYTEFPDPASERAGLTAIVNEGLQKGIRFLADRETGGVVPEATQWLNGAEAVAELQRVTAVRKMLLDKFNETAIRPGEPMSLLNERLVPVYLHHRYALDATTKVIGGMEYTYAMRGDNQAPTRIVPAERQRAALRELAAALQPSALAIPNRIVEMIPPSPYGFRSDAWSFGSPAGLAFDPLAVAGALASSIANGVLQPQRMARVISFNARNNSNPSPDEVIRALTDAVFTGSDANEYHAALRRVAQRAVVDALLTLAIDSRSTAESRAVAEHHLARVAQSLAGSQVAAHTHAVRDIRNWLEQRIAPPSRTSPIQLPPGTPIGN